MTVWQMKEAEMTTMKRVAWVLVVMLASAVVSGETGRLRDADMDAAIRAGLKAKGRHQGLRLHDTNSQGFLAVSGTSTGFWVEAYTPLSYIRQMASVAAKEYRTMTINDVTDEMRENVFRVRAHPDTPTEVTAEGMRGTSSVQHVVLRDERRRVTIQPETKVPFETESSNAMGGRVSHTGLEVTFAMDALREIRGAQNDREFYITVIGTTGEEKNFKVKRKHFNQLF